MRRNVVAVVVFLWACSCFAQSTEAPDPDKPALDRLMSLTVLPQPEWRYSADVAHPEDASLSDTDWPVVKAREEWKSGARVLRRWIEIPEQIDGYSTLDARVKLDLFFVSNERLVISVFSNGSLVARGDYDSQQPVLLTEKAQPGQKFLIAVRVDALEVDTQIYHSQLHIEPPATETHRNDFAHLLPRERVHVVDGELLSWWLSRTVEGLEYFYQLHQRLTAQVSHADDSSL